MMNFEGKKIFISGGSGSWGRELTKQLLTFNPKEIRIFSRGEISQVDMERKFNNPILNFVIGDVRDSMAVDMAMRGIDYVFHLAALKHVPICENLPYEAIQTNITGTKNLIHAAIKSDVKMFVDVSTDKAVSPINLYGYTKGVGERLTIQANSLTNDTEFICVRGGNVLGTNGSLVPYVLDQIKKYNSINLTDVRMTRFFLTLPQAIGLLLHATTNGIGGETYVMNMPAFRIIDLIEILIEYFGDKHTNINITGGREGEKLHEVLISEQEVPRTFRADDSYFVIRPQIKTGRIYPELRECIDKPMTSERTECKSDLIELLKIGGWL